MVIATTPRRTPSSSSSGKMLARLRHHRIVGGDHQQRGIDARCAGHHGVNESFMPGNIDECEARAVVVEMRESQLDRDAAAFFLGQPIHRAAGQRMDQRRLAVIDMSGQANHELRASGIGDSARIRIVAGR